MRRGVAKISHMAVNQAGAQPVNTTPATTTTAATTTATTTTGAGGTQNVDMNNLLEGINSLVGILSTLAEAWAGTNGGDSAAQEEMRRREEEQMQVWNTILGARQQDFNIAAGLAQSAFGNNDFQMQILSSALPGLGSMLGGLQGMNLNPFGQQNMFGGQQQAFGTQNLGGLGFGQQQAFGGFGVGGFQQASPFGGLGNNFGGGGFGGGPAWLQFF